MIDPTDPPDVQIAKQGKIIAALVRRANRQHEVGFTAYGAFQSAIVLQAEVWAKTRDLEKAASELEIVRFDRERARKSLDDALAAMEGGFALFTEGQLVTCNDLLKKLLPDLSHQVLPGLELESYLALMTASRHVVSTDRTLESTVAWTRRTTIGMPVYSMVLELVEDRWFQLGLQRTSSDNTVLLLTEITSIVRQNRSERKTLIDRQALYLQAVFEDMTSGVCTFSPSGEMMMHNNRFRKLLGLPYTALANGTDLGRILDYIETHRLFLDLPNRGAETWRDELEKRGAIRERVRHASGQVLDLQAKPLPDGGFLVELKDATLESRTTGMLEQRVQERTAELTRANARLTEQYEEKARVEEELRLAKERAEAAVSSKTRFLATASHDLLQPINAAKLLIATLREAAGTSQLTPLIERLDGSFTSIEQLLHSLLDISRLESHDSSPVTPTEVCLGTLMQGVHEDQTPVAERKKVQLDIVPSSVWVRSDPVYLLRSIQNLVVNAIQYTEPGGRVLVGCRRVAGKVQLQVWDTGIGIGRDDQKKIFEEFTRAGNVPLGSGAGLGLSVVDRACRHLGHVLRVRSKLGVGSVFTIEMDVLDAPKVETKAEAPLPQGPANHDLECIALVVENDADVLYATTQKLEQWGASVLAARSTAEALAHVRDIGIPPDIILADHQLDDGDTGIDTIVKVRELTGVKVPAIMITADRRPRLPRIGAELGFTVLTKPVQLSRLRPLIDWKIRWQSPDARPEEAPAGTPTKVGNDSAG